MNFLVPNIFINTIQYENLPKSNNNKKKTSYFNLKDEYKYIKEYFYILKL